MTRFNEQCSTTLSIHRSRFHFGKILSILLIALSIQISLHPASAKAADPTLTWDPNEDAEYYQVYMRAETETEYTLVSDQIPAGTTSFKLMPSPNGKTYYYSVKAFNTCGNSSDFSDEIPSNHIPYDPSKSYTTSETANVDSQNSTAIYQPINLEIILPEDATFGIAGSLMELSANVFKGDALSTDYMITWASSIDGTLGVGMDINATLSEGIHIITATSTDETGMTASASIILYIQGVNTDPSIEITEFVGGVSGSSGQIFSFKAKANDAEDGDLGQKITWSSNRGGQLGTGSSIQATLSTGEHTVTAQVIDSKGVIKTASVNVTAIAFNSPPTMTILELQKGDMTEQGMVVDIYGNASDLEEGDISAKISWGSSISGAIGKGAHIRITLVPGTHTITGNVTDSQGKTSTAQITISIEVYNHPPEITISTSHAGVLDQDGQDYDFNATAIDSEDGNISAYITWDSNIDGYLGTGSHISTCLSSGEHVITANVSDSKGIIASKTFEVNVGLFNSSPSLTLGSYFGGELNAAGQTYRFTGIASDPEDGNLNAYITWNSNKNGYLGTGPDITTTLSPGNHVITASANDSLGKTISKTLEVTVAAYNAAPSVAITGSVPGTLDASGQRYSFTATAIDNEDGDISSVITWTSSKDGYIGRGATLQATLSSGSHTITATVIDSNGKQSTAVRSVSVSFYNVAPEISITSVHADTIDSNGQTFEFSGSASDNEDGNLSAFITWTSSVKGYLGTGSAISTTLAAGSHTITASITDSQGKITSVTRTVAAEAPNNAPAVAIRSVSQGTVIPTGQTCTLSGNATDKEDGNLSNAIAWASNVNGALGKGSSLTKTLSPGSHVIKALITDSKGLTSESTRNLTVETYNYPPTVTEISYLKGSSTLNGQTYTFSSSASDKEDGDLGSAIVWTSSLSGALGKGSEILSTLRTGQHTITATVCDSKGACSKTSRTVTVDAFNSPPAVSILSAIGGSQNSTGQIFEFTGQARDKEEGTLSSRITWSSNIDGNLGQGSVIKPHLSIGTHTITAKVSDNKGKEDSQTLTVTSLKETRLELTVTTKSLYSFKLTSITWTGGSSSVVIYKNGSKIGTGPSEGTRYYWYSDSAKYKVCDSANLKCSDTKSTATLAKAKKKKLFRTKK